MSPFKILRRRAARLSALCKYFQYAELVSLDVPNLSGASTRSPRLRADTGPTTNCGMEVRLLSTMVQPVWRILVRSLHRVLVKFLMFSKDRVIAAAKANGIHLIVSLTNNWSDYGGMDVYVHQILGRGQPHDYFYTNTKVMVCPYFFPLITQHIAPC